MALSVYLKTDLSQSASVFNIFLNNIFEQSFILLSKYLADLLMTVSQIFEIFDPMHFHLFCNSSSVLFLFI